MKMKRLFWLFTAAVGLSALASSAPIMTLIPSNGAVFGNIGSTVGWGFTITDTTEFVLVTQTGFCVTAVQPSDLPCTAQIQSVGTYADFSFNIPVIGPSPDLPTVTQNFNPVGQTGFGSFQISAGAIVGTVLNGKIAVIYDLFTGDPNTNPNATQIGGDNFASLPVSVTVTAATTATPEPATAMPLGLGLAGLLWLSYRSRHSDKV